MTTARRFQDIDLSNLPLPPAIEGLDYEATLAQRLAEFQARWDRVREEFPDLPEYDVSMLETDPVVIVEQANSYHEMLLRGRVNDAVRAVMLATSWGENLDHLGARVGATRLDNEADNPFRRRIQLAYEALSTAGPYGGYVWHALSAHPGIRDAASYGPEEDFVEPGEAWVTLLASPGNGSPTTQMMMAVADRLAAWEIRMGGAPVNVWDAEKARQQKARPLTDKVIIDAAEILTYQVQATIVVLPGPDPRVIRDEAVKRLQALADARHRIGGLVSTSLIKSALHVLNADGSSDVDTVTLHSPLADVGGQSRAAPFCTGIDVTLEIAS